MKTVLKILLSLLGALLAIVLTAVAAYKFFPESRLAEMVREILEIALHDDDDEAEAIAAE